MLLRQRAIEHYVPLGVVRLAIFVRIIDIGRHPSVRKQSGESFHHGTMEIPALSDAGFEVWDETIFGTDDQLELGAETEGQVVTGRGRACRCVCWERSGLETV